MDTDRLVISLLDSGAMIGCFKKELSEKLNIDLSCIKEVWLENKVTDGLISQNIHVSFIDAEIKKEDLIKLDFKSIYENTLIFEVGDLFI